MQIFHDRTKLDKVTKSMEASIGETQRRRVKQIAHNKKHGITPVSIARSTSKFEMGTGKKTEQHYGEGENEIIFYGNGTKQKAIRQLQRILDSAIRKFSYEQAIGIKEQIRKLKNQ